jgi:hypothetical protein
MAGMAYLASVHQRSELRDRQKQGLREDKFLWRTGFMTRVVQIKVRQLT